MLPCPQSPRDHDVTSRRLHVTDTARRHRHVPSPVVKVQLRLFESAPQVPSSTLPVTFYDTSVCAHPLF